MTHVLLLLLTLPLKVQETNRFLQSCLAATLISRPMTSQRPRLKSQPDDLVVAKFPGWERSYIMDLATDRRTHHHHHQSCEQQHFGPNVGVQVVVEDLKLLVVVVVWQMKSINFYCTRGGPWDGRVERVCVIGEHVLSHIAWKPFCLWYIYTFNIKEVAKRCQWWKCQNSPCKK